MGRWVDVPGTVAKFWAKRSHLRLRRKRSAQPDTTGTKATRKRMRYIKHPEVEYGSWIRVEHQGSPQLIAQVIGHSESPEGEPQLIVQTFDAESILQDAPDGPYANPEDLSGEVASSVISLGDPNLLIIRLLVCDCEGKIRFVPQL